MEQNQQPRQSAVVGDHYLELRQNNSFSEFILGRWEYYGSDFENVNPSNSELICRNCLEDFQHRRENMDQERSYQVLNQTHPQDKWVWERGVCNNTERCFGKPAKLNLKRVFDVRRKDFPHKPHVKQYRFSMNNISKTNSLTVLDEFFVNVSQDSRGMDGHCNTGLAVKPRRPNIFHPNLFDDQPADDIYYINVDIFTKNLLPPDVTPKPIVQRPERYRKRDHVFPTFINLSIYRKAPGVQIHPTCHSDLDKFHLPVACIYLNVYSGGCGMAVHCFKFCKVADQIRKFIYPESIARSYETNMKMWYSGEGPSKCSPYWKMFDDEYPRLSVFVPNYHDGFGGPLTSFWWRMDDSNRYFS